MGSERGTGGSEAGQTGGRAAACLCLCFGKWLMTSRPDLLSCHPRGERASKRDRVENRRGERILLSLLWELSRWQTFPLHCCYLVALDDGQPWKMSVVSGWYFAGRHGEGRKWSERERKREGGGERRGWEISEACKIPWMLPPPLNRMDGGGWILSAPTTRNCESRSMANPERMNVRNGGILSVPAMLFLLREKECRLGVRNPTAPRRAPQNHTNGNCKM